MIKKEELVKLVKEGTGLTLKDTTEVIDSLTVVMQELIRQGESFQLQGVFKVGYTTISGKPEREGIINPSTGERGMLPATQPYNKPVFKVSKTLREEVKEKTSGNLF